MHRIFLIIALALLGANSASASWHYNSDAGFGAYQPEGWAADDNGRSTTITGPKKEDAASTEIFLGSDWISRIDSLSALEAHIFRTEHETPVSASVSGIDGFRIGTKDHGTLFLLRLKENVVVIRYDIRGSKAQKEEAQEILGSIEVRSEESANEVDDS